MLVKFILFDERQGLTNLLWASLSQFLGSNLVLFEVEADFRFELDWVLHFFEAFEVGDVLFGILCKMVATF